MHGRSCTPWLDDELAPCLSFATWSCPSGWVELSWGFGHGTSSPDNLVLVGSVLEGHVLSGEVIDHLLLDHLRAFKILDNVAMV